MGVGHAVARTRVGVRVVWALRVPRPTMMARRTRTSDRARRTRAVVQTSEPVMWWVWLKCPRVISPWLLVA